MTDRIPTSISDDEVARLVELAAGKVVLEIGSYLGHSTVAMAHVAERVYAVDWHRGDAHAGSEETMHPFLDNLEANGVRDKVIAHIGRSEDILPLFRAGSFDMAFIDAYHTTEAVLRDIDMVMPLVHVHGIVAFHDYGDERFGVTEAVDGLDEPVELTGTLAVVRKR